MVFYMSRIRNFNKTSFYNESVLFSLEAVKCNYVIMGWQIFDQLGRFDLSPNLYAYAFSQPNNRIYPDFVRSLNK